MTPRCFVFEFITGGGLLASGEAPSGSLLAEGQAMLVAVARDLANTGPQRAKVSVLWDHRLPPPAWPSIDICLVNNAAEAVEQFTRQAADAAWTVVIAPEFDGHLEHWCQAVGHAGGRWLGGSFDLVRLGADKHATASLLAYWGVPVPTGAAVESGDAWPGEVELPAVLKPRYGAGSIGVVQVTTKNIAAAIDAALLASGGDVPRQSHTDRPWRLETFCEGLPASVSILAGPAGSLILPPTRQVLAGESGLQYQGGRWPLKPHLRHRAMRLAAQVAESLHRQSIVALGYYGIDLVLGDAADGSRDAVIEVNPRFTASYVGLQAAANVNLMSVMLHLAEGANLAALNASLGPVVFDGRPLSFRSDGTIMREEHAGADQLHQPIEPLWIPHQAGAASVAVMQETAR